MDEISDEVMQLSAGELAIGLVPGIGGSLAYFRKGGVDLMRPLSPADLAAGNVLGVAMFPMVPYHAMPKLHELIKHDLPAPCPSIWAGYREMIPAFLRQLRYEDYYLRRELPPTARPYREDLHQNDRMLAAAE